MAHSVAYSSAAAPPTPPAACAGAGSSSAKDRREVEAHAPLGLPACEVGVERLAQRRDDAVGAVELQLGQRGGRAHVQLELKRAVVAERDAARDAVARRVLRLEHPRVGVEVVEHVPQQLVPRASAARNGRERARERRRRRWPTLAPPTTTRPTMATRAQTARCQAARRL